MELDAASEVTASVGTGIGGSIDVSAGQAVALGAAIYLRLRRASLAAYEALCRELSQDVHSRTVLDELLRLGLVRLDGETVVATARS